MRTTVPADPVLHSCMLEFTRKFATDLWLTCDRKTLPIIIAETTPLLEAEYLVVQPQPGDARGHHTLPSH